MKYDHSFHVSLKVLLKDKIGKILALQMPDGSSMDGYFDFPGGRIGDDEVNKPFLEIIERELSEEIGDKVKYILSPRPVSYSIHSYDSKKYAKRVDILCLFFEAEYIKGKIEISSEHKNFSWLELKDENVDKYFIKGPLEGAKNYLNIKRTETK
ncbi:MAG: hypothetical protein BWY19_00984 [bacterium ADurb.Bin212]|nr:MAG: hypothetical protein BWY19_00984 [bacterium ADurb.Bin212]